MARVRELCAFGLSLSILFVPVSSASPAVLGTVTTAQRAHVGIADASVGATIFGGDQISTEATGAIQIRAGAARFLLSGASSALLGQADGTPNATLQRGTALFSTANAKAFMLRASIAEIRPQSDAPTVAQVSIVNPHELLVRSNHGPLSITVEGETKIIPEASSYKVILEPDSSAAAEPAQGPRGAGAGNPGGPPIKAGKSHFVLIAITLTSVATGVAIYEALQSPDRP
jgi:hypothetical protein